MLNYGFITITEFDGGEMKRRIIVNAALCLRFYRRDGWTKQAIRKLLVNPKIKITYRKSNTLEFIIGDTSYWSVYGIPPNRTVNRIFKLSEIKKHTIEDRQGFGGSDRYIDQKK